MKPITYILSTAFLIASCTNSNDNCTTEFVKIGKPIAEKRNIELSLELDESSNKTLNVNISKIESAFDANLFIEEFYDNINSSKCSVDTIQLKFKQKEKLNHTYSNKELAAILKKKKAFELKLKNVNSGNGNVLFSEMTNENKSYWNKDDFLKTYSVKRQYDNYKGFIPIKLGNDDRVMFKVSDAKNSLLMCLSLDEENDSIMGISIE